MSELKPCRHLDYDETKYDHDCKLMTCAPHFPHVRYWLRGKTWTESVIPGGKPGPAKVQFCKLHGRINEVFACYNGEMCCYEPVDQELTVEARA